MLLIWLLENIQLLIDFFNVYLYILIYKTIHVLVFWHHARLNY